MKYRNQLNWVLVIIGCIAVVYSFTYTFWGTSTPAPESSAEPAAVTAKERALPRAGTPSSPKPSRVPSAPRVTGIPVGIPSTAAPPSAAPLQQNPGKGGVIGKASGPRSSAGRPSSGSPRSPETSGGLTAPRSQPPRSPGSRLNVTRPSLPTANAAKKQRPDPAPPVRSSMPEQRLQR